MMKKMQIRETRKRMKRMKKMWRRGTFPKP
jgi:hypothetical protein